MPPAAKGYRGNIEVSPPFGLTLYQNKRPPQVPLGSPDPFSDQGIPLDPCELCASFFRVAFVYCTLTKTQKAINTSLRLTVDGYLLLVWVRSKGTPVRSCTGAHIGAPLRWYRG